MLGRDPFAPEGVSEYYDLATKQQELALLPKIEGEWPFPASLKRLHLTKMPHKMLRRFEKKITPYDMGHKLGGVLPSECWIWTGGLHPKGYGRFWLGTDAEGYRIWAYAHRIAFEHWVGIPKPGYIVDHQCNVKTCCNPVHLWPESNKENLRLADLRNPWKRRNQFSKE